MDQQSRQWAMLIHFSVFAGYVVPILGLLAPILLWQLKKDQLPETDAHGKTVLNFMISMFLYSLLGFVLTFILIGIPILIALMVIGIVFPIIGGIKANNGELWKYPLMLTIIK